MSLSIFLGSEVKNRFSETTRVVGYGLLAGIPFGAALYHSQVHKKEKIRGQFQFKDWTMAKVITTGLSVGALGLSILYYQKRLVLHPKPLFPLGTIIGSSMVGAGMYLNGTCPGTAIVQSADSMLDGVLTIIGGIIGVIGFSFAEPTIRSLLHNSSYNLYINQLFERKYAEIMIPLSLALITGLVFFEYTPRKLDSQKQKQNRGEIGSEEKIDYKPYQSGAVIGLVQVLANFFTFPFGVTSGYVVAASTIAVNFLRIENVYLRKNHIQASLSNKWSLFLDLGIFLGALIWKYVPKLFGHNYNNNNNDTNQIVKKTEKLSTRNKVLKILAPLAAGAFTLFGARICQGCTSGHGITGNLQMSVSSLVATASMMGTGLVLAQIHMRFLSNKE